MRRFLFLALILCLAVPSLFAQGGFTTVTGTITGATDGLVWSCGTISAQLITAGGAAPTLNGGGFTTSVSPIALGCPTTNAVPAGSFSMRLADSGVIVPSNTTWQFTVNMAPGIAPPGGTGAQSFTFTTAINCSTNTPSTCTANSLSISVQLSALAPKLSNTSGGTGTGFPVTTAVAVNSPGSITVNSGANISASGTGQINATNQALFDVRNFGWVGDNSTDNCGAPVTNFLAAVNGYAGAGTPQAGIYPHTGDSAYKLSSCALTFLIPVAVHLTANLNCAQASGTNCIQMGPTGLVAFTNAQNLRYSIDGDGQIIGGANLTTAGIEVEPFIGTFMASDIQFLNFGAANATLGNCTNFAMKMDSPNPQFWIHNTFWFQTDGVTGRCWLANGSDGGIGSNTGQITDNTIGPGASSCASQGIIEGGFQSVIKGNNIFAFAIPIRIQGNGASGARNTQIDRNLLDSNSCAAKGITANIQYGANGSATVTGPVTLDGNSTNGTSTLVHQAGDSTGGITGWNITNNVTQQGSGLIFGSATPPTCSSYGGTGGLEVFNCVLTNNTGFSATSLLNGWTKSTASMTDTLVQTLAANTGPTTIITPPGGGYFRVTCTILLTQAATTSSTLPQCAIGWTDVFTNAVLSDLITPVWAPATVNCAGTVTNTIGNMCSAAVNILGKGATAITFTTSNYASVGGTPMQYLVDIRVEWLQ